MKKIVKYAQRYPCGYDPRLKRRFTKTSYDNIEDILRKNCLGIEGDYEFFWYEEGLFGINISRTDFPNSSIIIPVDKAYYTTLVTIEFQSPPDSEVHIPKGLVQLLKQQGFEKLESK